MSGLWKFDQDQDNQIPRPEDVRARLPLINFQDVQVDPAAGIEEHVIVDAYRASRGLADARDRVDDARLARARSAEQADDGRIRPEPP